MQGYIIFFPWDVPYKIYVEWKLRCLDIETIVFFVTRGPLRSGVIISTLDLSKLGGHDGHDSPHSVFGLGKDETVGGIKDVVTDFFWVTGEAV